MRPAGDIRHALLRAAKDLQQQDKPITMRAMAHHAQVGLDAARRTVDNMRRAQQLVPAGECPVAYRSRPVVVYKLPDQPQQDAPAPYVDLAAVFTAWAG